MSASESNKPNVIMPAIRRVMPSVIAEEICSVQPIPVANMFNPFYKKWERIGMDMPTDKWVFNIRSQEIRNWIEEQPAYMWKYYDIPEESKLDVSVNAFMGQNYIFTDEMEAWFQLRWS